MRSTMAPEMSAAVMMAKVPWKAMKSTCGMVPLASAVTPDSQALSRLPIHADPSAKARL